MPPLVQFYPQIYLSAKLQFDIYTCLWIVDGEVKPDNLVYQTIVIIDKGQISTVEISPLIV